MSRGPIEPGLVWFVALDPVRGREQVKDRPALVVSSRFHLDLTMGQLGHRLAVDQRRATRLDAPSPRRLRRGLGHHRAGPTVFADRFRRYAPQITLSAGELDEVRHVLAQMLIVRRSSPD